MAAGSHIGRHHSTEGAQQGDKRECEKSTYEEFKVRVGRDDDGTPPEWVILAQVSTPLELIVVH